MSARSAFSFATGVPATHDPLKPEDRAGMSDKNAHDDQDDGVSRAPQRIRPFVEPQPDHFDPEEY